MIFKLCLWSIFVFLGVLTGNNAFAHEGHDHENHSQCMSVYPCLENGEIDPQFDLAGSCGDHYRALCDKVKTSQIADELAACQNERVAITGSEAKLTKQLRNLRKKLKRTSARKSS